MNKHKLYQVYIFIQFKKGYFERTNMYIKMVLYSSLIIHNALCYNFAYRIESKIPTGKWETGVKYENLFYLNESIFDRQPVLGYPFYIEVKNSSIPTLLPNAFPFKKCSYVKGIFMSNVNISTISPGIFNSLTELSEIDLSMNELTQVEDGVFNRARNLKYLDLSYNYIKNMSEQSFTGLQNLTYLYLQFNQISLLYDNLFKSQVNSLLKLDLSTNKLQEINATFKGLNNLTHLFLQENNISCIPSDSLNNVTSLQYLDISYNSIQHIQDSGLENIKNCSVQNDKISFLSHSLFDSHRKSLTILNISSNFLKVITTNFHGMSHITHLHLQLNNISALAYNSFQNLSSLLYLDLSDNFIQDLPKHMFSGSKKITHLYLHKNKITFLNPNLFKSQRHSLVILNLSFNALKEISTVFLGLSRLTNLQLQENQISNIAANSFQGVISLDYLDISHNDLERFQYGLLDHFDTLKCLNFSYNKFKKFPFASLSYLIHLTELIFDNNKMNSLNGTEILDHFPSLQKIGLSGNFNWSCTKLVRFIKNLRIKKIEILKGNYFTGDNVRGMACFEDDFISTEDSKGDVQGKNINSKELINTTVVKYNNEINPNYNDKNIRDLINVILEKYYSGHIFIAILITINTVTLIVMIVYFNFAIKLKKNTRQEHIELL